MRKSALAFPDGLVVTIGDFVERYPNHPARRLIKTYCPDCREETHTSLSLLQDRADHFAHVNRTAATPFCLARDDHDRTSRKYYDRLPPSPESGRSIRQALADPKTAHLLWTAANVILYEQRAPLVTPAEFQDIAREVDKLDRWNRVGMKVGVVPQIILNHGDFSCGTDKLLFPIKRDNREHRPMLVPVHISADNQRHFRARYPITPAETHRLIVTRPTLGSRDPVGELLRHLATYPPVQRPGQRPQRGYH